MTDEQFQINRWLDCQREANTLRRGIAAEPYRLFGLSNWVWFTASALAGVCWAALTLQGY